MADTYFKQKAYDLIKGKILNCEYMPNSFINEKMIQEELDCSRTPIREALSRLEQENLLKIIPKKGILISDLSINEISMLYETRILIEPYILRNFGNAIPQSTIEEYAALFSEKESDEKINLELEADDNFHKTLCLTCPNKYLISCLGEIASQSQRVRILTGFSKDRLRSSLLEHKEIIDCLQAKDFEKAARAMESHLKKAENAAFNTLVSNKGWVKQN
jgi:DNA-binding GntR family transcriptional regulator